MLNQVTSEVKTKIEAWLESNIARNGRHYIWTKEDEQELFRKIAADPDNIDVIVPYQAKERKTRLFHIRPLAAVAFTLPLLLTASYLIWNTIGNRPATQQPAASNEINKIFLNDGTIVWLRQTSKLIYFENPGKTNRLAKLTGEGLFEVAKDASRPFIIDCGTVKVKVLGTSFNLRIDKETIELKVLTGKVKLSSTDDEAGIVVEPNSKVIYNNKGHIEKVTMDENDIHAITASTEYDMQFQNAAMDQIMNKIEKKFNVKFKGDNQQVKKCKITADFTDHSLESTLQMISGFLDFEYTISGTTIAVAGSGCK